MAREDILEGTPLFTRPRGGMSAATSYSHPDWSRQVGIDRGRRGACAVPRGAGKLRQGKPGASLREDGNGEAERLGPRAHCDLGQSQGIVEGRPADLKVSAGSSGITAMGVVPRYPGPMLAGCALFHALVYHM